MCNQSDSVVAGTLCERYQVYIGDKVAYLLYRQKNHRYQWLEKYWMSALIIAQADHPSISTADRQLQQSQSFVFSKFIYFTGHCTKTHQSVELQSASLSGSWKAGYKHVTWTWCDTYCRNVNRVLMIQLKANVVVFKNINYAVSCK